MIRNLKFFLGLFCQSADFRISALGKKSNRENCSLCLSRLLAIRYLGKEPLRQRKQWMKRFSGVIMFEKEQEDQNSWGDPPRYELVGDETRGKRWPGHRRQMRP